MSPARSFCRYVLISLGVDSFNSLVRSLVRYGVLSIVMSLFIMFSLCRAVVRSFVLYFFMQ